MCDLSFRSISFIYEGALVFGALMLSIEIYSLWFFPLPYMKYSSLSLLIDYSLKSILLTIRMATPACFLGSFD